MTGNEPPATPPWGPPPEGGQPSDATPSAQPPLPPYNPPGAYPPPPGQFGPPPGQYAPPGYQPQRPTGPQPPTYLVGAILATLFCCLPAGVVSIVYAAQVSSKWSVGDYLGAQSASKNARTWMIVSIAVGLVGVLLWIVVAVASAGSSTSTNYQYP
jgi:hypothetical protein